MPIDVKCPECGCDLEAPDAAAGKKVKCPDCGARVPVRAEAIQPKPSPPRPGGGRSDEDDEIRPRRRRRRDEDEEDDRPRGRRRDDNDYDDDGGIASLIPYKNGKALAAYYCGVFGLIPCLGLILGPIALVLGILGLRYARARPQVRGAGHAWAGIVLGSVVILLHLGVIVLIAVSGLSAALR